MASKLAGGEMKLPEPLSGKYKNSFAYKTIKDRLPAILSKTVDTVYRERKEYIDKFGDIGGEDSKTICNKLTKLRYELQTNKSLLPLEDDLPDVITWNQCLEDKKKDRGDEDETSCGDDGGSDKEDGVRYFNEPWLYVECYMYRRITESIRQSEVMKDFDVFGESKREQFMSSQEVMISLATYLCEMCDEDGSISPAVDKETLLTQLLQISLWGNRCDLSISGGLQSAQTTHLLPSLADLREKYLLVDHLPSLVHHLLALSPPRRVDIVLDNAGFELFTDLCLAEFLIRSKTASSVHFHGKCMPWFVSDTTEHDLKWTINTLRSANHLHMSNLGRIWMQRMRWEDNGDPPHPTFYYHQDWFWTEPHSFAHMRSVAPDLYTHLSQSNLIIFKGDLNYRKLVSDLQWPWTTDFSSSLQGFHPAPLVSLRTLKSDLCVGLTTGQGEGIEKEDKDWMIRGQHAVVQFYKSENP